MTNHSLNKIKGATMIEYVLIVALISIVAVTLMTDVGTSISTLFTKVSTALTTAAG